MTNKRRLINIVLWCTLGVVLLIVFIPLGSLLVQKYIKKSSVPMFMGYAYLVVATGSMNGTINQGDMIIVKKTDDYTLGDIVTFVETEGKFPVTHRIVNYGAQDGMFITKGDANPKADSMPVSVDQIAGEVVFVIPKAGLFLDWFTHEGGVIYFVAIIAIVIAGVYFWKLTKPKSETNTDNTTTLEDAVRPKQEQLHDNDETQK